MGRLSPLILNPVPVTDAWEIVTLELALELVSVSDFIRLLPIGTLPNPMLDGLATSEPAATPVPDTYTRKPDTVLANRIDPVAVPMFFGANETLNVTLRPAAKIKGSVSRVTENAGALLLMVVTVKDVDPMLLMVTDSVFDRPTTTLPKLRYRGLQVSWSAAFAKATKSIPSRTIATMLRARWGTLPMTPNSFRKRRRRTEGLGSTSYCRSLSRRLRHSVRPIRMAQAKLRALYY